MKKTHAPLLALLLSVAMLSACTTKENQEVEDDISDTLSDNIIEIEPQTPEVDEKIAATGAELTYSGDAQFVQKQEEIPCSEYAFDSEICTEDPTASETKTWYFVQIPEAQVNSELASYLDMQNESMVQKEADQYLINVGCKSESQIEGNVYGTFTNDQIDEAFETGTTHQVEFVMDTTRVEGDAACTSPITEFVSME